MKYLKTYEDSNGLDYEIYFTSTKDGVTEKGRQYQIVGTLDIALKKVKKLINSFLTLDKTAPRFEHWSLDDYWIEVYNPMLKKDDEKIKTIDKEEIDARFDIDKYNL